MSEESATLGISKDIPLAKNHRLLPRFDSNKDENYTTVRINLKRTITNAKAVATARFKQIRPAVIDDEKYKAILEALQGADPNERLRILKQRDNAKPNARSWITQVSQYRDWLSDTEAQHDYLWVYGVPGKGKLAFATDAVAEIKSQVQNVEAEETGSDRMRSLVVHFFCEKGQDCSSAEDVVKSLLWQLCKEEDILATYAKHLSSKATRGGPSSHLGIENLWQCLQDMLTEGTIGMVYFVIGNLHELSEKNPSTKKLLDFIQDDITNAASDQSRHVKTRWLFTSRDHLWLRERLSPDPIVRQINLDDNEQFGSSLRRDLRGHAWIQAEKLREAKGYNSAITYFLGSTIGSRADNKKWVDMTVIQLEALPPTSSDAKIRRMLERVPQAFSDLLDDVWMSVCLRHLFSKQTC